MLAVIPVVCSTLEQVLSTAPSDMKHVVLLNSVKSETQQDRASLCLNDMLLKINKAWSDLKKREYATKSLFIIKYHSHSMLTSPSFFPCSKHVGDQEIYYLDPYVHVCLGSLYNI